MKHIVIIGATSAMAEQCARLWAQREASHFTLVARDEQRCRVVAEDLRVRSPDSTFTVTTCDFLNAQSIQEMTDRICNARTVDIALIAHGTLPDQNECQSDLAACETALLVNGLSPALFAEALVGHMTNINHGSLAIIGSVAGDRGRKSNYTYGAAKGLVDRYAQGLQHRLAQSAVKVTLVKPGPTDSPMTAHLKLKGASLADIEAVAKDIVGAIERKKTTVYTPGKWLIIMLIIRHLPKFVFNKMDI
ncbi:MAG: SDR family NAD(P)-dependent oxidoreductase [Halomonadaceae bacterium]|nr:MAG: SDR family NAD(P)-dependent oxidoreductase [Halomonadaceae bacterium]